MAIFNGWRITRAGVVFVAGIIVLAALVFGGIWFVNQRGEQARRDEAVKIAEQQLNDQSEVAKETNTEPVKTESSQTNGATVADNTSKPSATELPVTGPETNSLIVVTVLALSAAFYVTSRRAAAEL